MGDVIALVRLRSHFLLLGVALVVVAAVGFLTVADELRHLGEFFAVLGILLSGLCLILAATLPQLSNAIALEWAPLGIGLGTALGAALDHSILGVVLGTTAGLLLARLRRPVPPNRPLQRTHSVRR